MEKYLELNDVTKIYRSGEVDVHALNGISFSVNQGEFVIITGASGAGKSTTLNIIGGVDDLTGGTVSVAGEVISKFSQKELVMYRRKEVGFVFQFYNLVQNLSALENVRLATEITDDPFDPADIMNEVGLSDRMSNRPSQLSGGEQQRVAIARALAKNPKILLCDEPTGALDYNTGKSILKLLQDTARKMNMTVIIVTQNSAIAPIGDKSIQIKNGVVEFEKYNAEPKDVMTLEW